MRWPTKREPNNGDKRVTTKFAWWPVSLDTVWETVWLEYYGCEQVYRSSDPSGWVDVKHFRRPRAW